MANVIFESELSKPHGASLQRLAAELPTEWTPLSTAARILTIHGFARDEHDAERAIQRVTEFGLAEWCPNNGPIGLPQGLYVRRAAITVRSEEDRRLIAGRVTLHTGNGDYAFNFDPDDPRFKVKKMRWTREQRDARAKAEADAKRSKPGPLKRLTGK